jgi:hypothetical protein
MHSSRVLAKVQGRRLCETFWVTQVIGVTQNVYGRSWWEERVDAVTNGGRPIPSIPNWP